MLKSKLNYHDRLDMMRSIRKSKQDNDMANHTGVISIDYDIELLRMIEQCAVYEEDEIGQ